MNSNEGNLNPAFPDFANYDDANPDSSISNNLLHRAMHVGKRAAQTVIIAGEIGPLNEIIRYGSYGVTQAVTGNVLASAAVLGGSTLIIEGAAALATADIIDSETSNRVMSWINRKMHKVIPEDAKMSPIMEAGVAMYGGSAVVLLEKQRENPNRTKSENKKHGLFTASWLAGVCALEGVLISEGITNPTNIKIVGPAIVALAGIQVAANWAKRQRSKESLE